MRKSKFTRPYDNKGRTAFSMSKLSRSGVYIIKRSGKIVYVGMSKSSVYKALYRHFQIWNDNREESRTSKNPYSRYYERVTYYTKTNKDNNFIDFTVRVVLCTPKQAEHLEKMLIIKYNPKDNGTKYVQYTANSYSKEVLELFGTTNEEPPF